MKLPFFAILVLFVSCSFQNAVAQTKQGDLALLLKPAQTNEKIASKKNKPTWNPLLLGYRLGINFYQKAISEQLATNCAFELTCSRFSGAMVKEYGLMKGYFLTFDRLTRCTKISSMETYPVRLNRQGKIIETPADFHFH